MQDIFKIFFKLSLIEILIFFHYGSFAQPTYTNISAAQNITENYGIGWEGGGVSFHDFDGDGWDDITFATAINDSLIFLKNDGGNFVKLTPLVQLTDEIKQVLWFDFDNDGDKDLFLTVWLGPNRLFENTGNMNLVDITVSAGLPLNVGPSTAAAVGDYDRDGLLDIYVCNYSGTAFNYTNYLYRNLGNGTFSDVTLSSNTSDSIKVPLGVAFVDYNNDMWPDIYIANDKCGFPVNTGNTLLENTGNGMFTDVSIISGANACLDAMCVTAGDCDNNDFQDFYITNNPIPSNVLLMNNGNGIFTESADSLGVGFHGVGWGSLFIDYDLDMDVDLFVSGNLTLYQGNVLSGAFYVNDGSGSFTHDSLTGFHLDTAYSYGSALGDINNDGYPDIIENNKYSPFNSAFSIWQNSGTGINNYLKIKLKGIISNADAVGSRIEVFVGGLKQFRFTMYGQSFCSQNSEYEFFGLETFSFADSIKVFWPSGIIDTYFYITSNQTLLLTEGESNCNTINPVSITVAKTNIACFNQNNGSISLTLSGGNAPYNYLWNTNPEQTTATISGLTPRIYHCIIRDNSDCIIEKEVEIREPTPLLNFFIPTNPSAPGLSDGEINLLVSGGVAPYTFLWSNGITTEDATGLAAGIYYITIMDKKGCAKLLSVTLTD